ncbi:MAG: ribosomal protein S18-alanine N-acetyltransferase [Alkalibacterium sp.]|nr:ribosomal protein S18-alanine N-acetyltransferase [Alkalibacterium sp.]
MKNFKEWFSDRVTKTTTKTFVPLSVRIRLDQPFYPLSDEWFLSSKIATEEDADSILTIEKLCYNGQTPWNRSAILHEIRFNKSAFYIVVFDKDKPVAFVGSWFVTHEAHITNIATIPEYQNKGIATYLLREIIKIAEKEDIKEVTLEVRVSNKTAQSLYSTLGFEKGHIKKGYYANDHEDALEMKYLIKPTGKE